MLLKKWHLQRQKIKNRLILKDFQRKFPKYDRLYQLDSSVFNEINILSDGWLADASTQLKCRGWNNRLRREKNGGSLFAVPHGNSRELLSGEIRIKVQHQQCPCPSHLALHLLYLPLHLPLKGGFQRLSRLWLHWTEADWLRDSCYFRTGNFSY